MEDVLPDYLSMGVSYERFMDSCPLELEPFETAFKRTLNTQNSLMYIQGLYFRDALLSSLGNSRWFKPRGQEAYKYPEEPYPMGVEDQEKVEDEKNKELEKFIAQENIRRANWKMIHKQREEGQ